MRLRVSRSKNAASLYVIKTVYEGKKEKTITVEKLGTEKELREKLNGEDPYEWAKNYISMINKAEKENNRTVNVGFKQSTIIDKNVRKSFNGGYIFLQQIYNKLGLQKICNKITKKYKFDYDLNSILSRLIYSRILFPASKAATFELSKKYIEQPNFELHQIYRALEVVAKESDLIQSELYKNSTEISTRKSGILYYDCTNYFFEIEEADGLKQYGYSKEHKPNPIVQMGLFMDGNGIPLAFNISEGNKNEQITLKPLERQIIKDFELSKFVVCTDSGLSSLDNRKFNSLNNRAFITTQSLKKLPKHLMEWALSPDGWYYKNQIFNINEIDEDKFKDVVFHKERWINENNFEQRLVVTYSVKYRNYQREIRQNQVERALNAIRNNSLDKVKQNDFKRLITSTSVTNNGEIAEKKMYSIDDDKIKAEAAFDGFYGICTNLEDDIDAIVKVNKRRWEIEESFRIMKTEFKARPVYLSRDDRIKAHFTTCFLSLVIFRYLEKMLGEQFTCTEIINNLRKMNFYKVKGEGYIPTYERNDFTDTLHQMSGFRTDYEIISNKEMKKIIKGTQN